MRDAQLGDLNSGKLSFQPLDNMVNVSRHTEPFLDSGRHSRRNQAHVPPPSLYAVSGSTCSSRWTARAATKSRGTNVMCGIDGVGATPSGLFCSSLHT